MAGTFQFGSSLPPSTPDRNLRGRLDISAGTNPSTTPAGPPPSSAASFTPAGAPSASYLGSSMMRGVTGPKAPSFTDHSGSGQAGSSSRKLFTQKRTTPL